ncbi:snurportin-1 [Dermatophagoides farinae]|uniref:snurportin-1 n=1 Tax=Dermatophagoides farinae TaxID=6954 RepID=UPI003F626056
MSEIELITKFDADLSVNQSSMTSTSNRIHPKFLHTNSEEFDVVKNVQHKRRMEFLAHVQRKRESIIEKMRRLIEDDPIETMSTVDDDDDDNETVVESSSTASMETECSTITMHNKKRKNGRKWIQNYRKAISDCFMLSEWLVDVPEDFFDCWFFVCCPKGRRTLLIADGGHTRAYTRNGHFLFKFQSSLPGGSSGHNVDSKFESHRQIRSAATKNSMLDCIWVEAERRFYILDVFKWNGCSFYGCDTEFRFFWIHNHINVNHNDNDEQMVTDQSYVDHSRIHIETLPYWPCTMDNICKYGQHGPYPFETEIDGILFYHKQAPYMAGTTPLVCWLKVPMLANIIGL